MQVLRSVPEHRRFHVNPTSFFSFVFSNAAPQIPNADVLFHFLSNSVPPVPNADVCFGEVGSNCPKKVGVFGVSFAKIDHVGV